MAFTISHTVLAPFISRIFGQKLPIAALAVGCMAPDLYRLFTSKHYFEPHQWDSIFSITIWIGLVFCLAWYALYRPALYRLLGLQDPLPVSNFKQCFIFLLSIMVALVLGICSHLIWDGLTHVDFRTFAFHDFLAQNIHLFGATYPMHRILQIGTSALALPVLIWSSYRYYQQHQQHVSRSSAVKYWTQLIVGLSICVALLSCIDYLRHIPSSYWEMGLYHITGRSLNEAAQGFIITFSLGCALFLFLDRNRRLS